MASQSSKVEFQAFHVPALRSGEYEVRVRQELGPTVANPNPDLPQTSFPTRSQRFAVQGARFELSPLDVRAVFPPAGSLGDHSNVLPHVVLERSTLPWERSVVPIDADDDNDEELEKRKTPWLALLLFDEDELGDLGEGASPDGSPAVTTLDELQPAADARIHYPDFEREIGQEEGDRVAAIDVPEDLLRRIVPTLEGLRHLAHVRRPVDDEGRLAGDELAVVIGSRLPRADAISVVHLVSLEDRYTEQGFDFSGVQPGDRVRLVSLKHWRLTCTASTGTFDALVSALDRNPTHLRLPDDVLSPSGVTTEAFLPEQEKLAAGSTLIPHSLRRGGTTASWYRGPLAPRESVGRLTGPVQAADELLRFDAERGMLDVTYAAAWELGKLLMLQDKKVATALYRWKRTVRQATLAAELLPELEELPIELAGTGAPVTEDVDAFFDRLALLQGVPFPYLVPDERMLPAESLRLFRLDPLWIDCLWDGAFSIGRVLKGDQEQDRQLPDSPVARPRPTTVTGFLMRSEVVSGWPDMFVRAYDVLPDQISTDEPASSPTEREIPDEPHALEVLRRERLAPDLLLILFEGEIQTLDVFLEPEALHFGLDRVAGDEVSFEKELRARDGSELAGPTGDGLRVPVPLRGAVEDRMVDIPALATAVDAALPVPQEARPPFTSAQFALQMVDGTKKARFLRGNVTF